MRRLAERIEITSSGTGDWHLGHADHDRGITMGPECTLCNLSAAGKASHRDA